MSSPIEIQCSSELESSPGIVTPLLPSPAPDNNALPQAPKFGTMIPNRIFVGGIAFNTSERELKDFFSFYGSVKDTKIIVDRAGVSKGYGFVTFESQEEAVKVQESADQLIFKDKKLNIGPAVRKQPVSYPPDSSTSPIQVGSPNNTELRYSASGIPYLYQNGVAYFDSYVRMPPVHHNVIAYPTPVVDPNSTTPSIQQPMILPSSSRYTTAPLPPVHAQPNPTTVPPQSTWSPPWRWSSPMHIQANPSPAIPYHPIPRHMHPELTYPYPTVTQQSPYPACEAPEMIEHTPTEASAPHMDYPGMSYYPYVYEQRMSMSKPIITNINLAYSHTADFSTSRRHTIQHVLPTSRIAAITAPPPPSRTVYSARHQHGNTRVNRIENDEQQMITRAPVTPPTTPAPELM